MDSTRFFVSNLNSKTTEKELEKIFCKYGEVSKVDLKRKDSTTEENVNIIAFVTVQIDPNDAKYCLRDLNFVKINGYQIKVSLAKESFLDRLKREREEANTICDSVNNNAEDFKSDILIKNTENTRKIFSDDIDDGNEDEDASELLITKKRAASSLYNGKIVIQNYDAEPIHVIERKNSMKHLDTKSMAADQKRKKSLHKMKNDYNQKKMAIQQAFTAMDSNISRKIKFSLSDDEDENKQIVPRKKIKTDIFGSDNDPHNEGDESTGLELKPEYFGKKGEKLLQMQSNQSLDPRFRIDSKFIDNDDEKDDEALEANDENNEHNERDWQMRILEQVVGSKINLETRTEKASKTKKMLRYDPSNKDDQKLLRSVKSSDVTINDKKSTKQKMKIQNIEKNIENEENHKTEVSKDVFYVVTDTLTQSLKTRGEGFSLLNMFGNKIDQLAEEREDELKKIVSEKIIVNNKFEKGLLNPFSYESSSDSDTEMQMKSSNDLVGSTTKEKNKTKNDKQKVKVVMETFFMSRNDQRFKEGAQFFKYTKNDVPEENYEEVRNRLKMLIKTKITKTKKLLNKEGLKAKKKIK